MKKKLITLTLSLFSIFFWGCQEEELAPNAKLATATSESNTVTACCTNFEVINFNQYAKGTIASSVTSANGVGPVGVYGTSPKYPGKNAAMIFDSNNPTGEDTDLKTPGYNNTANLQKVLIVSEDLDTNDPDDGDLKGSMLTFDFSKVGPVNICSFTVLDLEASQNENSKVEFFGINGKISEAALPLPGDNGVATGNYGVTGVVKMVITLNGSGAIDNIKFCVPEPPTSKGCTKTQGYWKTHSKYGPAKPYNTTWQKIGENTTFFKSSKTYYQVITTPPSGGNAYYILAHQYIAAKLNILGGASAPKEVTEAIMKAEELFQKYTPAQIAALNGSSSVRKQFISLAETLDKYNNGIIGPGHCK